MTNPLCPVPTMTTSKTFCLMHEISVAATRRPDGRAPPDPTSLRGEPRKPASPVGTAAARDEARRLRRSHAVSAGLPRATQWIRG